MKMSFEEIKNKFMEEQTVNDKPLSTITWASDRLWKWVSENFVPAETIVKENDPQSMFCCGNCRYEMFYDGEGSYCNMHKQHLDKMFPDLDYNLDQIGCKQFEQK